MRRAAGLLALSLLAGGAGPNPPASGSAANPAAGSAASPAAAATGPALLTLKATASPATYKPSGQSIDVLGIAPGMPPDTVRAILAKAYGNVVVSQDELGLDKDGTVVRTQSFVNRMTAQKDTDEIAVLFATPTTGNGVVEVVRQVSFRDERAAPNLQQVRADMIAQYGKPGFDGPAVGTGEVQLLAWSFHGNTPTPCPRSACRAQLSEGLDVRNLPLYGRAVKAGNELTVVATLLAGIADPARATGIVLVMSDAATKQRTLDAAVAQMRAALASPAGKRGG